MRLLHEHKTTRKKTPERENTHASQKESKQGRERQAEASSSSRLEIELQLSLIRTSWKSLLTRNGD